MAQQPSSSSSRSILSLTEIKHKTFTKSKITVMPQLLVDLLHQLSSALQEEKPHQETIDDAFMLLCHHCPRLSPEEWKQFLALSHAYMRRSLPERNTLYAHYKFQREPQALSRASQLLQHYEQIGKHAKQLIDEHEWHKFYRLAYLCLNEKGYYIPEAWLGEFLEEVALAPSKKPERDRWQDELKVQELCKHNSALKMYYEEFVRHLSADMTAAKGILSGRIDPTMGTGQSIMSAAIENGTDWAVTNLGITTALQVGLHSIPVGGAIANSIVTGAQKSYELYCKIDHCRNASRVCAWSTDEFDASQLAKALGVRLTLLRQSTLLSNTTDPTSPPKNSTISKTDITLVAKAKNKIGTFIEKSTDAVVTSLQELREVKTLSPAGKLASNDFKIVLGLLQKFTPNSDHLSGSSQWLDSNVNFLVEQFSIQIAPPSTEIQSDKEVTSEVKPTFISLPGDTFFHYGGQRSSSDQIPNQIRHDEHIESQVTWKKQWETLDKTQLDALINFHNHIAHDLSDSSYLRKWSESECQEVIAEYLKPVWSAEIGLAAITQAVTTARQKPWSDWEKTHNSLQEIINSLCTRNPELAQNMALHYRRALSQWQATIAEIMQQQEHELEELALQAKASETRCKLWEQGFSKKAKELGVDFNAKLTPQLPPLGEIKKTNEDEIEKHTYIAIRCTHFIELKPTPHIEAQIFASRAA